MAKTRAQIQQKVLAILTGGDIGLNPSAEDAETVDAYIDSVVDELEAEGVVSIPDADELDDVIFIPFCKLVAQAAAEEFGAKSDEKSSMELRNRIRRLTAQEYGQGPQSTEYF